LGAVEDAVMNPYPRVLVVEDDPITLLTFTLELQGEGFEVLGALSAREGQALLLTNEGVVAMVVNLNPRSDGPIADLVHAADALTPPPRLIYTAEEPGARAPDGVSAEVLIKPSPPKVLARRVRKALADG
jgi:DNA-binding response OmpR family regulator